jgi:hypothetical protein
MILQEFEKDHSNHASRVSVLKVTESKMLLTQEMDRSNRASRVPHSFIYPAWLAWPTYIRSVWRSLPGRPSTRQPPAVLQLLLLLVVVVVVVVGLLVLMMMMMLMLPLVLLVVMPVFLFLLLLLLLMLLL